jgi:methionine-rich copper-binding protein CopC
VAPSILVRSVPAAGSTLSGPVNQLDLDFSPPARLHELTVTGPDGTMPTMITPAAEQAHYSVPLSGLERGKYSVNWRATVAQQEHKGRFSFRSAEAHPLLLPTAAASQDRARAIRHFDLLPS